MMHSGLNAQSRRRHGGNPQPRQMSFQGTNTINNGASVSSRFGGLGNTRTLPSTRGEHAVSHAIYI